MTDAILTSTNFEEAVSKAYVQAIVAGAGYTSSETKPDLEGIDLTIQAAGPLRPRIDIQLKATINLGEAKGGFFSIPSEPPQLRLVTRANTDSAHPCRC